MDTLRGDFRDASFESQVIHAGRVLGRILVGGDGGGDGGGDEAAAAAAAEEDARECGAAFVAELCDAQLRAGAATPGEGCGLHFFVYDGEREVEELLARLGRRHGWRRGCGAPSPPPPD